MKKIFSVMLVLLLIGITSRAQTQPITIKLSEFDVTTPNAMLSDFATEVSYLPLETHPDGMIGDAIYYRAVHVPGRGFIIYNSNGNRDVALFFNEDGAFKNRIGKIGKGPGEYPESKEMHYDPYLTQWLVLTYFGILAYDLDGSFIKKVEIEFDEESYVSYNKMVVWDQDSWAVYYSIDKTADLKEIGVILVSKDGTLIKRWDLSDPQYPSTVGRRFQGTYLTNNQGKLYFSHFPGYKIEMLNSSGEWEQAYEIEPPFKETPLAYYSSSFPIDKLGYYHMENAHLSFSVPYGKYVYITGSFDGRIFQVYYEPETALVYTYPWDSEFNKRGGGITNDIDENFPIRFGRPDEEGYSYELVGAEPILDFKERGLLNLDGKRYGKHLSLAEAIDGLEPEDNPILVLIKMKE